MPHVVQLGFELFMIVFSIVGTVGALRFYIKDDGDQRGPRYHDELPGVNGLFGRARRR